MNYNTEYYLSFMSYLREAIRKKKPELWRDNSWFLHHDNAPTHTASVLQDFFTKNSTYIVPKPSDSPDLAPCDFWLFSKLKKPFRGHRLESNDEIKAKSLSKLTAFSEIDFNNCSEKKERCKCILSEGDYFGGDEIDLEE